MQNRLKILLPAVLFFIPSLSFSASKFVPPDGKVLLIIGQDVDNIEAYLSAVKIEPGGFAAYTSAEFAEGLTQADDNRGGIMFAGKIAKDHPNSTIQLALYMVDMMEKVYSGDLDASIDKIGNWIKSTKRPVYFRIGYEFDYPDNNYDPEEHKKAFRYIVERFRKLGVTNVAYVWHSYAQKVDRPYEDWYPGDNYVDWFAISYFDQADFTSMNKFADMAEKHHKPLMIAESCPWRMPTSKDARSWEKWFVPMLKFVEKRHVKALSYINCDWDQIPLFESMGWGDSRVQSNKTIQANWTQEISKEKYLKASPNLFGILGYTGK